MLNYFVLSEKVRNSLCSYNTFNDENFLNEVVFVHMSEIILEKTYKDSVSNHSHYINVKNVLKQIYPYIFENKISLNYPISQSVKVEISDSLNGVLLRDSIGKLYEDCFPLDRKKDIGQFYTRSNKVIDYMLDGVNYTGINVLNTRLIDPASGSGLFLINAEIRLRSYMEEKGYSPAEILNEITTNLFACDIDPFASYLTEMNLLIEVMDLAVQAYTEDNNFRMNKINVFVGDFTTVPNAIIPFCVVENEIFQESKELNDIKTKSGDFKKAFNLVISNPPYITMYGRRSRNMSEDKRDYYNTNYDFVKLKKGNNKFNSIMFFLERGIKAINDGQKNCFIIDMSFFETAFKDIRKYILDTCIIESITVNLKEFENVASGQLILILRKENNTELRNINKVKWIDDYSKDCFEIEQYNWDNSSNEYKFFRPMIGMELSIIKKIEKFQQLYYFYPNKLLRTCCALTGRTEDFMTTEEEYKNDTDDLVFPYLEGSKGIGYKFCHPSNSAYLKYDYDLQQKISEEFKKELTLLGVKNKKRIALGNKQSYISPKLFIRQSSKELIATYTEEKYASNNSLYILTAFENTEESRKQLKYVCALLNSNLITFYSQKKRIIRMGNGKTPQIKISDLQTVRLNIDKRIFNEVITLVDVLLTTDVCSSVYINILQKVNCIIYESYGITNDEILFIEEEIKKAMK